MKAKAEDLIFVSQIKRDGSGTHPVEESYLRAMEENELMKNDKYKLNSLSITEETWIASGFNSFVVKVKDIEDLRRKNKSEY